MAQVVVDSQVMRDKAQNIKTAGDKILTLYTEMLQEVNNTAGSMKGTTIETEKKQFASMQTIFETFKTDMTNYSTFLTTAAENYEAVEQQGTQMAREQGKVF